MSTFTVHRPPLRKDESAVDPERFVFVRDGFYFWAFLLAPLWLLVHRLWLVLVLYVAFSAAIEFGLVLVGAAGAVKFAVALAISLLVGFEAATLWRWTLARRRWAMLGFVVGKDLELAERRFYGEWAQRADRAPPPAAYAPAYAAPVRLGAPSSADVIGLFPEPGSKA
jgi:hypothetical protein